MTSLPHLFDRLALDLRGRLRHPDTAPVAARWAQLEPSLRGLATAADAVTQCRVPADPVASRTALASLVRLSGEDPVASDAVLLAVIPALRVVAGELSRRWHADPADIDQDVAAAGWARVRRVAGRDLQWPDRVIAGGARDDVRSQLRSGAHRCTRVRPVEDVPDRLAVIDTPDVDAADLVRDAVARGVVTPASARLVWATRVMGLRPAELTADRRQAKTLVMARRRAEHALQAEYAGRAGRAPLPEPTDRAAGVR